MTEPTSDFEGPVEGGGRAALLHDRRAIAGIGVAVVAVGVVAYVLLSGGSSSSTTSGAVVHGTPKATASVSPTATAATLHAGATAAPALRVRDPFSPLYTAPSAAGADAAGTPSIVAPASTPSTAVSSSSPPTVIVVEPTSSPGPTATKIEKAKYTLVFVKVLSTKTDAIEVKLNGVAYTLEPGHNFFPDAVNGPFELTGLVTSTNGKPTSNGPASFLYGDASFSMLVGETQLEN